MEIMLIIVKVGKQRVCTYCVFRNLVQYITGKNILFDINFPVFYGK